MNTGDSTMQSKEGHRISLSNLPYGRLVIVDPATRVYADDKDDVWAARLFYDSIAHLLLSLAEGRPSLTTDDNVRIHEEAGEIQIQLKSVHGHDQPFELILGVEAADKFKAELRLALSEWDSKSH
ncbi:MAG: hypothetical protein H0T48_13730 [Gemmatimonadaceae bacterium]|nr:hypothetical protein [Gemmatimonadaceae bacterium]